MGSSSCVIGGGRRRNGGEEVKVLGDVMADDGRATFMTDELRQVGGWLVGGWWRGSTGGEWQWVRSLWCCK